MKKIEQSDFILLFSKARHSFTECLSKNENNFLIEELGVPLNSLIIENDYIKVTFLSEDTEHFTIETKIRLLSPKNEKIGCYSIIENEVAEVLDDTLVFV